MTKICQRVLDGFIMPAEWALSIVVLVVVVELPQAPEDDPQKR